MACKLIPDGCVFPTECKDGVIVIHTGVLDITVEVPWLHQVFQFDNAYFDSNTIMIHLLNEKYRIVFRRDGTVTTYNRRDEVVMSKRWTPIEVSDYFEIWERGSVMSSTEDELVYGCKLLFSKTSDTCIIDTSLLYHPFYMNNVDNQQFISDVGCNLPFFPTLLYDAEKSSLTKYQNGDLYYSLNGEWLPLTGIHDFL